MEAIDEDKAEDGSPLLSLALPHGQFEEMLRMLDMAPFLEKIPGRSAPLRYRDTITGVSMDVHGCMIAPENAYPPLPPVELLTPETRHLVYFDRNVQSNVLYHEYGVLVKHITADVYVVKSLIELASTEPGPRRERLRARSAFILREIVACEQSILRDVLRETFLMGHAWKIRLRHGLSLMDDALVEIATTLVPEFGQESWQEYRGHRWARKWRSNSSLWKKVVNPATGETIAHRRALLGTLPMEFHNWGITDAQGRTVEDVARWCGDEPW
ncbi:MAG: hypothetical protein LBR22_10500 [Desulfovibrio sp.]|jgi:hypothetical protein|nr:hypothetical protein [Desulfovibrio sp.]